MSLIEKGKFLIKRTLGLHPKIKLDHALKFERHGSDYGGWNVLAGSITAQSVVYSFGIGEDISFDLAIIKKYGVTVFGFDPTPRVSTWLDAQELPPQFKFMPVGIAAKNGQVDFFTPKNPDHISHSAQPSGQQHKKLSLKVKTLASLASNLGHQKIDLLKMDIEGFEYAVIADILTSNISISQILIEFHHGMYGYTNQQTIDAVNQLKTAGYKLFCISDTGREYSFIR